MGCLARVDLLVSTIDVVSEFVKIEIRRCIVFLMVPVVLYLKFSMLRFSENFFSFFFFLPADANLFRS